MIKLKWIKEVQLSGMGLKVAYESMLSVGG
jgi:hypothetical protein